MWNKIQRILIWTQQVRPHVQVYEYTFKWNTMTQVANDWWLGTSWWNIDSNWLYRNSWTPLYITIPFSLATAKKITLYRSWIVVSSWTADMSFNISSGISPRQHQTGVYCSYNSNNQIILAGDQSSYTRSYSWETTFTYVVDLVNKSATLSFSNWTWTPSSWAITDAEISETKTYTYITLWQNWTPRIWSIKITVE